MMFMGTRQESGPKLSWGVPSRTECSEVNPVCFWQALGKKVSRACVAAAAHSEACSSSKHAHSE